MQFPKEKILQTTIYLNTLSDFNKYLGQAYLYEDSQQDPLLYSLTLDAIKIKLLLTF